MRGKWVKDTRKYSFGEIYKIGRIPVGSAFFHGGSKGDADKYAVSLSLPGIKTPTDRYTNLEDAKARVERAVEVWFSWLEDTIPF